MSEENKKRKEKEIREEDLSAEDLELKQRIDEKVASLIDESVSKAVKLSSLESLKKEVKESTTTMTSVPKPFKFLKVHYQSIYDFYQNNKSEMVELAPFTSLLSMSFGKEGDCLEMLLEGGKEYVGEWGYNYISHISREVGLSYQKKMEEKD